MCGLPYCRHSPVLWVGLGTHLSCGLDFGSFQYLSKIGRYLPSFTHRFTVALDLSSRHTNLFPRNVENVPLSPSRKDFLALLAGLNSIIAALYVGALDKGRHVQAVRPTAQVATASRQLKTVSTVWSRRTKGWFTCTRGGKFLPTTQSNAQFQLVNCLFISGIFYVIFSTMLGYNDTAEAFR